MIKQWMDFCDTLPKDAKLTAETIADALARDRDVLAEVFYQLSTHLPRKHDYTVFVRPPWKHSTYIHNFEAYNANDARLQARSAASKAWGCEIEQAEILGVIQGNVTVLEWADEA